MSVPWMPRLLVYNRFNAWGRQRELPPMPRYSFRELYRQRPASRRPGPSGPPDQP